MRLEANNFGHELLISALLTSVSVSDNCCQQEAFIQQIILMKNNLTI